VHKGGGSRKITVWVENTRSYVKKKITKTKRAVGVAQVVERLVIKKKKKVKFRGDKMHSQHQKIKHT
jgi:hypothetical protein